MLKSGTSNQACAACKHQRRKCTPECPLAPFFPPEQTKKFQSVHKIYGVSNILKIINSLDTMEQKYAAVDSIYWEAHCRDTEPVEGSYGYFKRQKEEIQTLSKRLEYVTRELCKYQQQLYGRNFIQSNSDSAGAPPTAVAPTVHMCQSALYYPPDEPSPGYYSLSSTSNHGFNVAHTPHQYYPPVLQECSDVHAKAETLVRSSGFNHIRGEMAPQQIFPLDAKTSLDHKHCGEANPQPTYTTECNSILDRKA
eukprot:Gb_21467 [translate_table: standard]